MWIKIKGNRIDFSKVSDYAIYQNDLRLYYMVFSGEENDDQHYDTVLTDSKEEAKEIIKKLDELLKVVEL
jgi:hypothetical protein